MKAIKLSCYTRGSVPGDILPVGGKGNISEEDAHILVDEGMASEYTEAVIEAKGDSELKAKNKELLDKNIELQKQIDTLTDENKNLTDQLALATGGK